MLEKKLKQFFEDVRDFVQYHLDNLLMKGILAQLGILVVTVIILIVLLGCAVSLVTGGHQPLYKDIWRSFMHVLDQGTITSSTGSRGEMAVLLVATLIGLAFTSTMIGIVNSGIRDEMEDLSHGRSKVMEPEGHILVLGYSPLTLEIITRFARKFEAGRRKGTVVVLYEHEDIVDVDEEIDREIAEYHKTKIVCRQGCIFDPDDLDMCSVERARAVLIMGDDDQEAIKSVLVCKSILEKNDKEEVPLTVVLDNRRSVRSVVAAGGENVRTIVKRSMFTDIISGIREVCPDLLVVRAGDKLDLEHLPRHLFITADYSIDDDEDVDGSDDEVIEMLLQLRRIRQHRGDPGGRQLWVGCEMNLEKNAVAARLAGADQIFLVGQILTRAVSDTILEVS